MSKFSIILLILFVISFSLNISYFIKKLRKKKYSLIRAKLALILLCFITTLNVANFSYVKVKKTDLVQANFLSFTKTTKQEYQKKNLEETALKVYLTLKDKEGRIVSTTNSETPIDAIYEFKNNSPPEVRINLEDELVLNYDITNFFDANGNLLVDEDTIYYTDIPSYIIPAADNVVGTEHGPVGENRLYKSGNVDCFGGIYMEGKTGYRLKIRFENTKDQTNIKFNYQILFNLSNTIKNQPTDLKSIDFESLGILQFWMDGDNTNPDENEIYTLTEEVQDNATSGVIKKFVTTITDNRPEAERELKGVLKIDMSDGIGISNYTPDFLDNVEIYADGQKIPYMQMFGSGGFYGNSKDNLIIAVNFDEYYQNLDYDRSNYNNQCVNGSYQFTCFIKSLSISFGNVNGNDQSIKNVKEWKIVLTEKIFNEDSAMVNNVTYHDLTEQAPDTSIMASTENKTCFSCAKITHRNTSSIKNFATGYDVAYNWESNGNYVEMNFDTSFHTKNGQYYYLSSKVFGASDNFTDTFELYIDDSLVTFVNENYSISATVNGCLGTGDSAVELQMKKVLKDKYNEYFTDSSYCGYDNLFKQKECVKLKKNYTVWHSQTLNENGEYYWVIFDMETMYNAYKYGILTTGREEFAKYTCSYKLNSSLEKYCSSNMLYDNNLNQNESLRVKMYIFNISKKNVKLKVPYKLGYNNRVALDSNSTNNVLKTPDTPFYDNSSLRFCIRGDYQECTDTIGTKFAEEDSHKYMSIQSENMIDDIIKWEIDINTSELSYFHGEASDEKNGWYLTDMFLNLPPELELLEESGKYFENYFYDSGTRTIKRKDESLQGEKIFIYYKVVYVCLDSKCESLLPFSGFSLLNDPKEQLKNMLTSEYIPDYDYNSKSYGLEYIGLKNNIYDGHIKLIFFTKKSSDVPNGSDSDNNHQIYFQFSTGGGSVFNNGGSRTMVNYVAKASALNNVKIVKTNEELSTSDNDNEDKNLVDWKIHTSAVSSFDNYTINSQKATPTKEYSPTNLSGVYQFSEKFNGTSAPYTKLKSIHISGNNRYYNLSSPTYTFYYNYDLTLDQSDLENFIDEGVTVAEKCIDEDKANKICVKINYNVDEQCATDKSCLISKYGENYREKLLAVSNGFNISVRGLLNAEYLSIEYVTETDNKAMYDDFQENNQLGLLTGDSKLTLTSETTAFDWGVQNDNFTGRSDLIKVSSSNETRVMAEAYVDKQTIEVSETLLDGRYYLSRDNTINSVFARIGYVPSAYVDVKDIMLGFEQYSDRKNIDDDAYLIDESNKKALLYLKQYLEFKNFKITYCNHFNDFDSDCNGGSTIYENGKFLAGWTNSKITFDKDSINLYDIHFENDAGVIPATSGFKIEYELTFDIDNKRQIADENGNTLPSFRESEYYKGQYLDIISTVGATRAYETDISEEVVENPNKGGVVNRHQELMDKYQSFIDKDKKTLTAYAVQEIQSGYLKQPTITKKYEDQAFATNEFNWQIIYNAYSTGKAVNPSLDLTDTYYFALSDQYDLDSFSDSEKATIEKLNELLLKYSHYADINLFYKDNIYRDSEYLKLNELTGILEDGKKYTTALDNQRNLTIEASADKADEHKLHYNLEGIAYDSSTKIEYKINVDFESFYTEALKEGLIDEDCHIKGTDKAYVAILKNVAIDNSNEDILSKEAASGYINVATYKTQLTKTVLNQDNDRTKWQLKFNTGTSDKDIDITDEITPLGDEAVKKAITIGNLTISLGAEVIYENNVPVPGYEENIEVIKDGLTLKFKFKNSETNQYLSENKVITINYETYLDEAIYNEMAGQKEGTFSLENKARLEKGPIISQAEAKSDDISFDFPLTITKSFLGNPDNDLTKTSWNIKVNTGAITRKDVYVTDTSTIDENYQKYFRLTSLKITSNKNGISEVLYDSNQGLPLPEGLKLYSKDNEELVFNQNGAYNFIVYFQELSNLTEVSIDYTLAIDREKYEYEKEVPDKTITIKNVAEVKSDGLVGPSSASNGTTMFPSILKKTYRNAGKSKNNLPLITWSSDVNLAVDYGTSLTDADQVVLADELDDILRYYNDTLKLYALETTTTKTEVKDELILDEDYSFTYENNTLTITLLKPSLYNNFRVTFDTELLMTSNELKNYLLLSVNGQTTVANAPVSKIFTNIAGGTVTSQGITYYSFYAQKFLDGKMSATPFTFKLESVDYEGNKVSNGTEIIAQNDTNGNITFGPIAYKEDGIYYYKISEINEGANYNYDTNSYIVKVKVINYKYNYIVDEVTFVNNEVEEMNFYNTTKEEINNPNTSNKITIFLIMIIISGFIFFITWKKKRMLS